MKEELESLIKSAVKELLALKLKLNLRDQRSNSVTLPQT